MNRRTLIPDYQKSWALVIGVDNYRGALPPLNTAVKGAQGLAQTLESALGFDPSRIILLTDKQATQRNIRRALTDPFSRADRVGPNDRVVIYFAGHGLTFDTAEGEVGCVAPYDVESGYIDTTIPMDELTRLANRIHAKHVLFLLDACFSGFATTRDASAGVERQVADFLTRPARQVITAGTREQAVSDYWGPGGHSLFTGFLLEGLGGSAPAPAGVMRAFHLAGYLQDQVAQHSRSLQTPQYAALIGSQGGDFIFGMRQVGALSSDILNAAASDDPAQRMLAVGRLRGLAKSKANSERAAEALARLEELAASETDAMVRASARAALSELIPQTHVAPVVREELAGVATHGEALDVVAPPGSDTRGERARVGAPPAAAAIAYLLGEEGPAAGKQVVVRRTPFTIGRTPDNDLALDDDKVSRHHARIEGRGRRLWIEDQGSTNGTIINGHRLPKRYKLQEGDRIGVGRSVLTFTRAAPEPEADATPSTHVDGLPVLSGAGQGQTGPLADDASAQAKKRRVRLLVLVAAGFAVCSFLTCLLISWANSGY